MDSAGLDPSDLVDNDLEVKDSDLEEGSLFKQEYLELTAKEFDRNRSTTKPPTKPANVTSNFTNNVESLKSTLVPTSRPGIPEVKIKPEKIPTECKERKHIGFVKVHKAASTSMHIILYRYALEKNLTPMLFIRDPFPFARFRENLIQFPNKTTLNKFDMMVEHSK